MKGTVGIECADTVEELLGALPLQSNKLDGALGAGNDLTVAGPCNTCDQRQHNRRPVGDSSHTPAASPSTNTSVNSARM